MKTITLDTLRLLAANEASMASSGGGDLSSVRHNGAAWAYYDVAVRMYGNELAKTVSEAINAGAKS